VFSQRVSDLMDDHPLAMPAEDRDTRRDDERASPGSCLGRSRILPRELLANEHSLHKFDSGRSIRVRAYPKSG
jgi:hypothetical protein